MLEQHINVEANWWSVGNNKLNNVAMLLLSVMMLKWESLKKHNNLSLTLSLSMNISLIMYLEDVFRKCVCLVASLSFPILPTFVSLEMRRRKKYIIT